MYNVKVRMERKPIIGDKFCHFSTADVLTTDGWIKIGDITKDHLVYIYNPITGNMYYENPQEIHIFDYNSEIDGKMYQLKSSSVDLTVTPNHRMWVKKEDKYEFILAKDCFGKTLTYYNALDNINPSNGDVIVYDYDSHNWVDYKGTVHCLTVSTGIFMVRENGKPVWTGNSNRHG